MKVILSRKGFDSGYGRCPSPIFPDGRMASLPIPARANPHVMGDLSFEGIGLGDLARDLSAETVHRDTSVHLDPDLQAGLTSRLPGWRPSLGQIGAAQSHLRNHGIAEGDVFLFFGWFREVEKVADTWKYVRGGQGRHVIFGWLEIDEILDIASHRHDLLQSNPWLSAHPHLADRGDYMNLRKGNTIYVGKERSGIVPGLAGAGAFSRYRDSLCLTWPGRSRSQWKMPRWMMPRGGQSPLTYHPVQRWTIESDDVLLKSAAKGQEFILDTDRYPEAESWIKDLLSGRI